MSALATFRPDMPLQEAQATLRELVLTGHGHECPCCTQLAKIYKRPIHSAMAHDLIRCYRAHGALAYFDLTEIVGKRGTGDVTKLRYWGLLEPQEGTREDGSKRNGRWRVTELGERFVKCHITVHRYARCYDKRCLGLVGDQVTIRDCLGDKFDYAELMSA